MQKERAHCLVIQQSNKVKIYFYIDLNLSVIIISDCCDEGVYGNEWTFKVSGTSIYP